MEMLIFVILLCGFLSVEPQNVSLYNVFEVFGTKNFLPIDPIICAKCGCIRGKLVKGLVAPYEAFYGIPYAEPPVNELRFANPIPHRGWARAWDASYPRSSCLHKNYFNYRRSIVGSEDCLYLNIYRPAHKRRNLPVLVFIHGGGFISLTSAPSDLGPDYFMATDALILVTLNYRLGIFGFLCSGDEAVKGNFGLKDQQLALQWVAENIEFFGGDRNSITLAGQNAGAASVNLHMINPKSQALFHRAILMSGSALASPLFPIDFPDQFRLAAKVSGVKDWDTAPSEKLVQNLRIVHGQALVDVLDEMFTFPGIPPVPLRPCIEGNWEGAFLTEAPQKVWSEGRFVQKPMLLSLTRDEGIVEAVLTTNKTLLQDYNKRIRELLPIQLSFHPRYTEDVLNFYFGKKHYIDDSNVDQYYQMISDRLFRYQFFQLISQYVKYANLQQNPIYIYEFGFESSYTFLKYITGKDINLGVGHFDDLLYLFCMPGYFTPFKRNTPEWRMSGILLRTWINFIARGEIKSWGNFKPCTEVTSKSHCDRQVFERWRKVSPNEVLVTVTNNVNESMIDLWSRIDY